MSIKGFKAMDSKMMCRGFQFKEGETYTETKVKLCNSGFHFCKNVMDVYSYYPKTEDTIICEIEALGEVKDEGDKSATDKIKIVKKLTDKEVLAIWIKRTNSGNRNSGDWNSGDGNSGYFNTVVPLYFFNKPSVLGYTKELENKLRSLNVKPILEWVPTSMMSEKEKADNPKHVAPEGFLRKTERMDWRYLTEADKSFIKSLPNFDDAIFKQISGVSLSDDVEVTVNGVMKTISKADAVKLGLIE